MIMASDLQCSNKLILSLNLWSHVESKMADPKPSKRARGDSTPVYTSLQEFSQGSEGNSKRYEQLVVKFEEKYGSKPQFLARAPGRVNIIGEHIDYSGYAVLPMALEQDITVAWRPNNEGVINMANVDPVKYPDHSCPVKGFTIDGHQWYQYFLCGYKGVLEHACIQNPVGFDLLMDGSIPPSAGLSSSSAVVCCAALVAVYANKVELPSKKELAELCAHSERYIGTEGGGMDQAISFLAERGKAMMIEFNPIRPTEVQLPNGMVFVISNTLVQANKAAFASFNERVVECRLAAQVIAKQKGLDWRRLRKLINLQEELKLELREMNAVVSDSLQQEAYSRDDICKILEISSEELESESLSDMTKEMESFHLYKRATHVFQEAHRVPTFRDTANSGSLYDTAVRLGELMDASHATCSGLYECSCAELDQLVAICKSAGSLGSRLTGAGWGGCAVSLVAEDKVEAFLTTVANEFYEKDEARRPHIATSLFKTKPGPGAALCDLSGN